MKKYITPSFPSQRRSGVVSVKNMRSLTGGIALASIVGLVGTAPSALAVNGVWNQSAVSTFNWSDAPNWSGGIPNGIGETADLSQLNLLTGKQTISLGGSEITLGSLLLGDTNSSSVGYYSIATGTIRFNSGSTSTPATLTYTAGSKGVSVIESTVAVILDSNLLVTNLSAGAQNYPTLASVALNGNTLTSVTTGTDSKISYSSVTGNGSLVVNGEGAVILSGATMSNTFAIAVNSGRLLANSASMPKLGDIATSGTGTVQYSSGGNSTYSKSISGSGRLLKDLAGILTLTGINTYTGSTTVSAGTLKAGVASTETGGAFGKDSAVVLANAAAATLDLAGYNTRIGSLTGGGTTGGNVTLGTATLTVGGDNTSPAVYAGVISGNGGVTKIGIGKQILSGSNSYTGATSVSGGELAIAGSLDSSTVTVDQGAILSGIGSVAGSAVINGKLASGDNGIGSFKTGSLTLGSTGIFDAELGDGGASDKVEVTGSVTIIDGAELKLTLAGLTTPAVGDTFFLLNNNDTDLIVGNFSFTSGSGPVSLTEGAQFQWNEQNWKITYLADAGGSSFSGGNDIAIQVQAVPEPATWALLVGGLGMLISMQGLRKRSKAS